MTRNRSIIGMCLICSLGTITLQGCNSDRYVSDDEFFDSAMTRRGPGTAEIYGYVPPQETRAVDLSPGEPGYAAPPRVIYIDGSRDEFGDDVNRHRAADVDDADTVIVSDDENVSSFREFTSEVKRQVELMQRDLAQLSARAEIKGAAAQAALEPAARDLRMYFDEIESRLVQSRNVEDLSASSIEQAEIRQMLRDARESLNEAEDEINSIPAVD